MLVQKSHILIVDDDPQIGDLLSEYLERHGYRVSVARDGHEMKRVMKRVKVDLVVLDIMLPGDDGLVLCRFLRETSELPIIMLSAVGEEADRVLRYLRDDAMRAYDHYEEMISQDGQQGLARELARMNLPANIYTQWYWKVDLHNLFHFLRLRADAHAQYEIRVYADAICEMVKDWVPAAYGAFEDYRLGGATLSGKAVECIRKMVAGEKVTQETSGMSKGEWREFMGVVEE